MPELRPPVLVLTNDDGVDAPGMQSLRQAAERLGRCVVVAPRGPMSGCGHQVTTHLPIDIERRSAECFAVAGTPVDCVRLALHSLAPDACWVLSGINAGGNLGTDVYHSGTVAAVREAAIRGLPGMALSHYIARGRPIDWTRAAQWAGQVLKRLIVLRPEPGTFWNVNLPHPAPGGPEPSMVFCDLDPSPLPADFRIEDNQAVYTGNYQARLRRPGADVAVCFGGDISVTPVRAFELAALASPAQTDAGARVASDKMSL
jgi:5'-nucleotidase